MPRRLQRKREKGYKNSGVYCGRPTKYGNPFSVKKYGRNVAMQLFNAMLKNPEKRKDYGYPSDEEIVGELKGKDLSCWCEIFDDCHVDRLLRIANS